MTEPQADNGRTVSDNCLLVDAADPTYADTVISDLTKIRGVPSGMALLRRLSATGHCVAIMRSAPTDPPNAWVRPSNRGRASELGTGDRVANRPGEMTPTAQTGFNSVIAYDPTDWPSPAHPSSPASDAVLFALLLEACGQIETPADANPHRYDGSPIYDAAQVGRYQSERDGG